VALAAQGFYDPLPPAPNRAALRRVLRRVGLFQIDSVNVLVRSHYLPLFSRIGPYPMELLRDAAWGSRAKRLLFEYWAHEASLVPLEYRPLLIWRMQRAREGHGMWNRMTEMRRKRKFVAAVLQHIREHGPATASSFENARGEGSWWGWSDVKIALEFLFWAGELTAAKRTTSFERVYDLTERVFGRAVLDLPVPESAEAHRQLLGIALDAMGVATEADLRDYFRLEVVPAREALHALVDAGSVSEVRVEGWKQRAYARPDLRVPRRESTRSALLSPFDSLIWNRDRAHRLFDFHYRIEIYTPAHKRVHGYYVLPLLHRGRLVGRADLKADRERGVLLLKAAHFERPRDGEARAALNEQLDALARWLGLDAVEAGRS
jgi:uncharacterized protein YcaQ